MADKTSIDPDGARRIFSNVEALAGDLEAALKSVETVRSTLNEPWGTDEYGKRYAQGKEPNAVQTLGYVKDAIKYVRDMGEQGKGAVDEFQNLDGRNGKGLAPDA